MKKIKPVRIVQFEPKEIGPWENAERMAAMIRKAREDGVGLVVFPENAIAADGTDPALDLGDLADATDAVVTASEGLSVVFNGYLDDAGAAAFILAEDGKLKAYGAPEENMEPLVSAYSGKFAVVPYEDLVNEEVVDECEFPKGTSFIVAGDMSRYSRDGDTPASVQEMASRLAKTAGLPVFYANGVGVGNKGKVVEIHRGDSAVFDARGRRVALATPFEECALTLSPADCGRKCALRELGVREEGIAELVEALRNGLRKFMAQMGVRRVVIGVSGGIDSAVSTALYGSILKPEDILLVSMPGPFTSATTRGLARALARNIGARFAELPIGESVELTKRQFAELVTDGPHGAMAGAWSLSKFAVENVQARDRGSRILAAAAAAFGGVVSCNANKDECTVGYGTMYGDITGWLCCLGDLWKGDVYAVGRYLNEKVFKREVIPEGIFNVKPSAELSENQAVEKGLGDPLVYPYHDRLFRAWVEDGFTPCDCLETYFEGTFTDIIGYDGDLAELFPTPADFIADLERWWNMYRGLSVAKRLQAPPILAVGGAPFGEEPESQGAPYYGRKYRELKEKLLSAR